MYNYQLRIILKVIKQRRLLKEAEEVEYYCDQAGTTAGSLGGKSKLLDSMAMLDCEAEIKNSLKELKLQSATIKSVNGNGNVNKNVDDTNDSFKFDIFK